MKKISKYLNYEVEQFSKKYKQKKEEELKKLNDTYGPELVKLTTKREHKINNETLRQIFGEMRTWDDMLIIKTKN